MNILDAEITKIKKTGELALVELICEGDLFSSLVILNNESYIFEGNKVKMIFKETEVSIAKGLTGEISLRNRFASTTRSFKKGELLTEIVLDYKGHEISSVITTASFENMQIDVGTAVLGLVKTNELMLKQND